MGQLITLEGVLMVLPMICSIIYREQSAMTAFAITIIFALAVGFLLMSLTRKCDRTIYAREGFVITALTWVVYSIIGAAPFVISGAIPSPIDAFFETVSGFTTTGASILTEVEPLDKGILFWRSFTHWIGGMGILVLMMAILSDNTGRSIHIMRAEMPGPIVDKITPRIKNTAKTLYLIYLGVTVIEVIFLLCGGMSLYESLVHTFGTVGTGGFGVKNDSIAGYSPYLQWVITIFMILFGVNFNAYYFLLFGQLKKALGMEEVRWYLIIILVSTGIIFATLLGTYAPFEALTHAAFQVGTIITTTGFATADFDQWSSLAKTVLVLLMFVGACAGSTGGGIKVSRIIVFFKSAFREIGSYIHPRSVNRIKVEGRPVEHEAVRSINVYLTTYMVIFALSILLVSIEGQDVITTFTAVAATINNIGPGLAVVGPTGNFSSFTLFSKWVLIFDMLAGRLELFPMLILFHPTIWKQAFQRRTRR